MKLNSLEGKDIRETKIGLPYDREELISHAAAE